jgi:hypothetical protein
MEQVKICKFCSICFQIEDVKKFANHVRWCDKNTTNGDKGISKRSQTNLKNFIENSGELKNFSVTCKKCQKVFDVLEREKRHPEKLNYFCSRACANSRGPRTDEFKEKVRSKIKGIRRETGEPIIHKEKSCEICNKTFFDSSKKSLQITCSRLCSVRRRNKHLNKTLYKYYRQACNFNFNLADFPNEFNFSLIEEHGWYSAKNCGNNLNGVSRDHIVSVKFGYENGIDPKVLSHPANCQLLLHGSNVSKGKKCGITYEQLLQKIVEWNKKYNTKN